MGERLYSETQAEERITRLDLYASAVEQLPQAIAQEASEAWNDKRGTTLKAVRTVGTAGMAGVFMGYLLPSGGPAGWLIGAALTAPLVIHGVKRLEAAYQDSQAAGASLHKVSFDLARDTVKGSADLALTFAGGWVGAEGGHLASASGGRLSGLGQRGQRLVLLAENEGLAGASRFRSAFRYETPARGTGSAAESGSTEVLSARASSVGHKLAPTERSVINRRLDQYLGASEEGELYFGTLHGHSKYSDGMGSPAELYAKAKAGGQKFTAITDHNHLAARDGVKPGDPRTGDQADVPVVAENPIEYAQTFADAKAATTDGEFVALVGTEMGTIGKVGGHHGGVNHINILEVPTFFEAVRQPRPKLEFIWGPLRRVLGLKEPPVVKPPEVIKYNDGDYNSLVTHLDKLTDTTGGRPVIQLNHPRYLADENPNLAKDVRGRDYGQKSFKSLKEWRERFGKYASQIEVIKGEALNPNPVDTVKTGDHDPTSFAGYIDKGLHVSPTFGRDFHYGNPVGNPAGTGILATSLDKPALLNALRERRTIATTNTEKLTGILKANDRHAMGSILDQAAAPDLTLKVKIGGQVSPEAKYTVKIWGDKAVGDRKLAEVLESRDLTGAEIAAGGNEVAFDPIAHLLGKKSAYYAEVLRTDPQTAHVDRMWTAPIWIEPLSGQKHGLWLRGLVGSGANSLLFASPAGA